MADDVYSFGTWVRLRRQALVLSRTDLAREVGVAEVSLRKIEADERRPSPQVAALLAQQLQLAAELHPHFVQVARGLLAVDRLPPPIPGVDGIPSTPSAAPTPHSTLLPSGTVTFLFTDIEGSTRLWEQYPTAMAGALARHDALLAQAISSNDGLVFKTAGDAVCAAFARAPDALTAALAIQRTLHVEPWTATGPLRVRIGLHTGAAEEREGDYFGPALNRVARLMAAGHGGQILLSLATEELVREHLPPDTTLRDLGMHRLKDLSYPEQIFQLVAEDLPADFPKLNTLNARRTNLPAQPTALIGREQDVAAACALLRREGVRLITLTGPGGTGKTRLAFQVAAELLDAYVDGVYFVNLAPISDPPLVTATIMQALGIAETNDQSVQERLSSYIRDKQMLLLLDNFEQIVDAAPTVTELLAGCPQLTVLVTSRVLLHLRGEREIAVQPLALPDLQRLPAYDQLTQYAAIQLFIQRACDVRPNFVMTNDNAPVVAEICARLDGLPLAIELAAARIKLFAPEALLARLSNRLELLTGGARDLPHRQQTLRSAIAWSYNLLDESAQALFVRLGVFVGGCTLEAAEAVCGSQAAQALDVLDPLEFLVDSSLLKRDGGTDGELRFVLLQTIREYAVEKLAASGDMEMVRRRHAEYFLALAEAAEPRMRSSEQIVWLECLDTENDNIRAALTWYLMTDGHAADALHLATVLWRFWRLRGYLSEGRTWLAAALAQPRGLPDALRARALNGAGFLARFQGDSAAARVYFTSSLEIGRASHDPFVSAEALLGLGEVCVALSEFTQATPLLEESLAHYRAIGHAIGCASALHNLGEISLWEGEFERATAQVQESLALFQAEGDQQGSAFAFRLLGGIARNQGDLERATTYLEESLTCSRAVREKRGIAWALSWLSWVWLGRDNERVHRWNEEALTLARELGDKQAIQLALSGLGEIAASQVDYPQAKALFEERLMLCRELGNKTDIAWACHQLADIMRDMGDYARAIVLIEECLALWMEVGDQEHIAYALNGKGDLALHQGNIAEATVLYQEALVIFQGRGDIIGSAWAQYELGRVAHAQGEDKRAANIFLESLAAFQECETISIPVCLDGLAGIIGAQGQPERAARIFGAAQTLRPWWAPWQYGLPIDYTRDIALIRAQLDDSTFAAAWAAGQKMTLEQAVAYTLASLGTSDEEQPTA